MKQKHFMIMANTTMVSAADVLELKSAYATGEDVLASFKQEAALAKLLGIDASNPRHRAVNEIVKKCCRMIRAEECGFPGGIDSIDDLVVDTINYALLFKGLVYEETTFEAEKKDE